MLRSSWNSSVPRLAERAFIWPVLRSANCCARSTCVTTTRCRNSATRSIGHSSAGSRSTRYWAIHIGTIPVRRGRDLAEFGVVSGALALMTNIVMAFNAGQLQKSVDAQVANGTELSECIKALEHVGPVAHGDINFRGTYAFPIDRYAARIIRAAA